MIETDLFSQYADEAALKAQTAFILEQFKIIDERALKTAENIKIFGDKLSFKGTGTKQLIDEIKRLDSEVDKYRKTVDDLTRKMAGLEKQQKNNIKASIDAQRAKQAELKTEQEVIKTINAESAAEASSEKAKQAKIKTSKDQLTYEQALAKQRKQSQSDAEAEARLAEQLTNEYALLGKALKDAEQKYKNLALTEGFEAEATKNALEQAKSIRTVLDKVDSNLGNYQRNVGNYKSAFDGLGLSFTQVARELPSLTISAQQFFLAISNNLPMVFDEIGKARAEIAALRAEGQETPGIFSRIAKSALSLQVGLSILVTLFTVFGGKIIDAVSGLFGYNDALEKSRDATARYQKAQLELIRTQQELNELYRDPINDLDRLEKNLTIAQNLNKSKGDLLELERKIAEQQALNANQEFLKTGGFDTLSKYTADLAEANQELQTLKTRLRDPDLQGEDAQKNLQKAIDRKQITVDLLKKQFDDQLKIVRNNYATLTDLTNKQNDIEEYNRQQKILKETEFAKIAAQARIDAAERALADERNFEEKRADALKQAAANRKKIIDETLRVTLEDPSNKNADGTFTAEAQVAQKNAAAEKLKIDKDLQVALFNNSEEFRKRRLAAELETYKAQEEFAAASYKKISESDVNSLSERMTAYGEFYKSQQELALADFEFQKATKVMTNKELIALEEQLQKKFKELAEQSKEEISKIFVDSNTDVFEQSSAAAKLFLSRDELQLYRRLKNKAEYAKKSAELDYQAARNELIENQKLQQKIIDSSETTAEAKKAAQEKFVQNQIALNNLELSEEQKKEAKKASIRAAFRDLELQALTTFFDVWQKLEDARYQKRIANLEKEKQKLDENTSKEIENIRNSTLSEQEKAAAIIQLQAQQAAKKQEIENKQKQEKIKQAKTDKAIAVAKIIAEAALAQITAWTEGDPYTKVARSIAAGIAGASALASALAAPIPEYAEGTDNHPGGPAIVGEKKVNGTYQRELVKFPGGKTQMVDKPTLFPDMPLGTQVLTGEEMNREIYNSMIRRTANGLQVREIAQPEPLSMDGVISAMYDTASMTINALKKQKSPTIILNNNAGWGEYISKLVTD